jgi:hypothetical protein
MTLDEYKKNPYAWPGGYTLLALMGDGEVLCHHCVVNESEVHDMSTTYPEWNDPAWKFEDCFIHWEGDPLFCAHCNKELPSEYGPIEE